MVRGITLNGLIGQNLRLGHVLVRVEDKCNPCNNMEKRIGPGAKDAMNDRGGIRCRVIEGGGLRVGDKITVEEPGLPLLCKAVQLLLQNYQLSHKTF